MLHSGVRRLAVVIAVLAAVTVAVPHAEAKPQLRMRVQNLAFTLTSRVVRPLPFAATNVAFYWKGRPNAQVTVAFSHDGKTFGKAVEVGRDEAGEARHNGTTYGAMLSANGARAIRVTTDTPALPLNVLALLDPVVSLIRGAAKPPNSPEEQPATISRAQWGADESLRFKNGTESWPPAFAPVQKLIVHHTATTNGDTNPAATVRAIYHYHAITQGWGDIGYNFLIDESGRIYKGRNSHAPGTNADSINGQDPSGRGVTGAHAQHFNAGSVGIALLGTLTTVDATPAAKNALERLLAWEADTHGINPTGASTYKSPVDGAQKTFPNIAGHRDVNPTTECPGDTFYGQLPAVRAGVATRINR